LSNPYAQRLEIAYMDHKNLGCFEPGLRFPTLGQGEVLTWSEHRDNWILERWTVREHGLVLFGPQPRPLIDPISPAEITQTVRSRLQDWADWANDPDDADWLLPLSHEVYVVETMYRAWYTLTHHELSSKAQSVAGTRTTSPEPWRMLVEQSLAWRTDDIVVLAPAWRPRWPNAAARAMGSINQKWND
jgi:hypothetical protein